MVFPEHCANTEGAAIFLHQEYIFIWAGDSRAQQAKNTVEAAFQVITSLDPFHPVERTVDERLLAKVNFIPTSSSQCVLKCLGYWLNLLVRNFAVLILISI